MHWYQIVIKNYISTRASHLRIISFSLGKSPWITQLRNFFYNFVYFIIWLWNKSGICMITNNLFHSTIIFIDILDKLSNNKEEYAIRYFQLKHGNWIWNLNNTWCTISEIMSFLRALNFGNVFYFHFHFWSRTTFCVSVVRYFTLKRWLFENESKITR